MQEPEDQQQWRNERDRARRAAETAKQRSESLRKLWERSRARCAALLKLPVKDKLLHSGKNGCWDPRGERNEEQKFSDTAFWMRRCHQNLWRNNFLHRTATHKFPHPFISYLSFLYPTFNWKNTRKLQIWVNPCFTPHWFIFYYTFRYGYCYLHVSCERLSLYNNTETNQFQST